MTCPAYQAQTPRKKSANTHKPWRGKDSRFLLDLGLSLDLGKGYTWTLNARNLFNEPTRWTENTPSITSSPSRLQKYERYGTTWTMAVQAVY